MAEDILLVADLHLTDKDEDLYRWDVFDHMRAWADSHHGKMIIIAGDLCDRKDRHSSILVNTVLDNLRSLEKCEVIVMLGNHDKPLYGPPYWSILQNIPNITWAERPVWMRDKKLLLLPYSDDPKKEWEFQPVGSARGIIMHQTVTGVIGNNGHELINDKMPDLNPNAMIYSGDIHNPQCVEMPNEAQVLYIGAPHPVCFGDTYDCRMLVIDGTTFECTRAILLTPPAKHMIEIYSLDELRARKTRPGDAAHIRFFLAPAGIDQWPVTLAEVKAWAVARDVRLNGVEPVLEGVAPTAPANTPDELINTPDAILQAFFGEEGLGGDLAAAGASILKGVLGARASSATA